MANLNSPIISGDVSGGLHSTSVDKLKGQAVASTTPSSGQVLTWDGTQWAPATSSSGGGGGANGLTYYLRQDVDADAPTTNLPGTPKQLGRTGAVAQTSITSGTLTSGVWTLLGGYVSESVPLDPNTGSIPGGLWDLNLWALGTANQQSPTLIRAKVYTYNGADAPTLLATSGEQIINTVSAQYSVSVLVPQTTVQLTTRIYVAIEVQASANNHTATLQFGDGTPSHVHTSLPLVGGTGLWHSVAGILQPNASLLVDADVASDAAIASNKLATVQVAQGGTGQTTYTNGQLLIGNTTGNTLSKATLTAGSNVTITNGPGTITIAATGTGGVSSFNAGTTGLTPNTATTGDVTLAGTLAIANGGTGATTRQDAMDALAGATTSGQYLRGNGTDVVMSAIQAVDVPTLNQSTTGTASNVTGTVAIANGGTGATTQQAALNAIAGATTTAQFLRGNGTNVSMSAIQAADVPTLNQSTTGTAANVTGVVAVANGGTGQTTYTDGQILIGNTTGNTLAKATLTAGTNVTITNGPGSITIASTGGSATPTAVQTFINNGTWTKPAGARMVNIQLLGAGGGGGSGRKDTTSGTVRCGGGGGGGGSYVNITVPAVILGATETVTIGISGIGGGAQATDATNGTGGQSGTATSFGSNIIANGGTGGGGGTATTGTNGTGVLQGNNGSSASTTGGIGGTGIPSAITSSAQPGGAGGGSGGGLGTSNTAVAGAAGGRGLIVNLAGGLAGAANANASNGNANGFAINGLCATGSGGGSGGSSITASGGNGGNGGFPAAGGGGGGACGFSSGFSGAGGSGGAGMAVITTYF